MQNDPSPLVSILIICWNSGAYLSRCLEHLSAQTIPDFEVVLVDNGSTDGGTEDLPARFPTLQIRVEKLASNRGFAVANNLGSRLARGEWLALLNADAFPAPDWLEQLIRASVQFPARVFFASRQLQADAPGCLDGEGDVYHVSGMVWRRNYGLPARPAREVEEVFSASGAAAMFRRADFLEAGGFDERYFAYLEDVDLGFRLRLAGWRCLYVPLAVVHHIGSASTGRRSDFAVYQGYRNLIWTFFKDMPSPLFWLYLPMHVLSVLSLLAVYTVRGQGRTALSALADAVAGLPLTLHARAQAQGKSIASAKDLRAAMSKGILTPWRETLRRRQSHAR